jgi:DNA primase
LPLFPEQFINAVQQATDIVELVSQYVALKKRGREFVGLCPYHDDKSPSMYVTPAKQIFKCFACGAGGGVFQWMMMYEKMSFPEAVRALAERANIPLPDRSAGPPRREGEPSKSDLLAVTGFAETFYRRQLNSSAGKEALDYARLRELSEESLERFGVGYAPDAWDALTREARAEGISERMLLAAGLVSQRESGGVYDRFRNRLILPIYDAMGRCIAFGGRALDPEDKAKYLNSPETMLFDKSANLYALNWARDTIVRSGTAVVVEGYFDALMPIQLGMENVVATLGTALTERHVRLLSRYANDVVLVFDADEAGTKAAERALETFLAQQVQVRVATIPQGKDPCDFCLAEGIEAFGELIDKAPDALQYVWDRRLAAFRQAGGNLADRQRVVEDFLRLVASSEVYGAIDEVRRGQLAQHIGHILNVPAAELQQQMKRLTRRIQRRSGSGQPVEGSYRTEPVAAPERYLLEVILAEPELFDQASERVHPEDFTDPRLRWLAERIWARGEQGPLRLEELLADPQLAEVAGWIVQLSEAGERRGNNEATLRGVLDLLAHRQSDAELRRLKEQGLNDDALRRVEQSARGANPRRIPRIM